MRLNKIHFLKIQLRKLSVTAALCFVYLFAFSIRFFTNIGTAFTGVLWFGAGVLIFFYIISKKKYSRSIISCIIAIDIIGFACGILNGNGTYMQALYIFSAQVFGVLIYYSRESLRIARVYFFLMYLYVTIRILFFPTIDINGERAVSNLIGHSSVSIIMISACVIDLFYNKGKIYQKRYLLYFIGILVSFVADSNGGVVCFAIFILGIYICSNRGNRLEWWKILLLLVAGIGTLYLTGYLQRVIDFSTDDNSRLAIWGMYISIALKNFKNFIIGAPMTDNLVLYTFYNNNMHNNFLNWHLSYGIIPTLTFLLVVVYEFVFYVKNREWIYAIISGTLIIRSMPEGTDYCFMVLWTYLLLDVMKRKNKSKKYIISNGEVGHSLFIRGY